jgi:hypothetical protein
MARSWTSLGSELGRMGPRLVFSGGIKVVETLRQSGMLPRAIGTLVTEVLAPVGRPRRGAPRSAGVGALVRPVASVLRPTATRARPVVYAPDLAGPAHPGEVVWAWVHLDGRPGADVPVLVVGREEATLLGLVVSCAPTRPTGHDWVPIGIATWDSEQRPTWVRVDHVLDVPEAGIRREGAVLDRRSFDLVAHRLCGGYRWK